MLDHDRSSHLSSTNTSDATHDHPLVTPFIHPSQPMNNPTPAHSVSTATATNNQSQATALAMPKVFTGMPSTIDRSAFRQQPPPMKVEFLVKNY